MIETIEYNTAEYPKVTYAREPIPVAVLDGVPWWSTAHIQHIVRKPFSSAACDGFASDHVGAHRFPFDGDDELSHVISTEAAFWLLDEHPFRKAYRWASSWLWKRQAEFGAALIERPALLKLGNDGELPPKPDFLCSYRVEAWRNSVRLHSPTAYQRILDDEMRREAERAEERRIAQIRDEERRARNVASYSSITPNPTLQG